MTQSIPEHWRLVPLSKVAEIVTGNTPSKSKPEYYGDSVPFVTPAELGAESEIITAKTALSEIGAKKARLLPPETVLVCCIGSLGKTGITGVKAATNQQINALIFDPLKVHPKYGYYISKRLKPTLEHIAPSTTVAIVNKSRFGELQIPLPPLKEQRRIAAILDKADAIRRKRQRAIELTETFLRSVFLDMFGDPVTNPKGWEKKQLKDLVREGDTINYGVIQPGVDFPGGVPIVRVGDFKGGSIDKNNLKHIDPKIESAYQRSRLMGDEILVACVGSIGEVALLNETFKGFNIVRAVSRIRCSPEVNRIYLASLLSTPAIKGYFISQTRVVAQPTLNIKQIKETEILLPPIENQNQFVEIYNQVKKKAAIEIEQRHRMGDIFRSLAQKAFKGALTKSTASHKEAISA